MKKCSKCGVEKALTDFAKHHWCRICQREYMAEYRARNAANISQARAAYRHKNKARLRDEYSTWYAANRDGQLVRMQKYKRENAVLFKAAKRRYYVENSKRIIAAKIADMRANPAKYRARDRAREAAKVKATPKWANKFFIEQAYELAALRTKMFGFKWHVDHIVPVKSRIVCGLHVECNLQVIPGAENIRKGNRYWPDMPA